MSDNMIIYEVKEICTLKKKHGLYYECSVGNLTAVSNHDFVDIDERTMEAVMRYFDLPHQDPQLLVDRKERFLGIGNAAFACKAFNLLVSRALSIRTYVLTRQDIASRFAELFATMKLNEVDHFYGYNLDQVFHCLYRVFRDPRTINFFIYDFTSRLSNLTAGTRNIQLEAIELGNNMNMAITFSMHDTEHSHVRKFKMDYLACLDEINENKKVKP